MGRRKNYFIKKRFQADFFMRFTLLLILEALLISFLFMFISRGTLVAAYHETGLTIKQTGIYFLKDYILITCLVGAGIGVTGIFVFMFLSHRIGGPLYRIEQTIDEVIAGDMSKRINLRVTDELLEVKDRINTLLDICDVKISNAKHAAGQCERSGDTEQIKRNIKEIKESLDFFKTSN